MTHCTLDNDNEYCKLTLINGNNVLTIHLNDVDVKAKKKVCFIVRKLANGEEFDMTREEFEELDKLLDKTELSEIIGEYKIIHSCIVTSDIKYDTKFSQRVLKMYDLGKLDDIRNEVYEYNMKKLKMRSFI